MEDITSQKPKVGWRWVFPVLVIILPLLIFLVSYSVIIGLALSVILLWILSVLLSLAFGILSKSRRYKFVSILVGGIGLVVFLLFFIGGLPHGEPKCYDCVVKASFSQLKAGAEFFHNEKGDYGPKSASCYDSASVFNQSYMKELIRKVEYNSQHKAICYSTSEVWAVSIELRGGGYYCADSTTYVGPVVKNITEPGCAGWVPLE